MATSLDDFNASLAKFGSGVLALQQAISNYGRGLQAFVSQINSINAGPSEVKAARTAQVMGLATQELKKLTHSFESQLPGLQENIENLRGGELLITNELLKTHRIEEASALGTKLRVMKEKALQMQSNNSNFMASISRQGELSADLRSAGAEFIQLLHRTNGALDNFCSIAEGISAAISAHTP